MLARSIFEIHVEVSAPASEQILRGLRSKFPVQTHAGARFVAVA